MAKKNRDQGGGIGGGEGGVQKTKKNVETEGWEWGGGLFRKGEKNQQKGEKKNDHSMFLKCWVGSSMNGPISGHIVTVIVTLAPWRKDEGASAHKKNLPGEDSDTEFETTLEN